MNLFSPTVAYASLDSFISSVDRNIINPLISFIFAVAVIYFLYGAMLFFLSPDQEEARTDGKSHMMWGIIGITIMMGVWFLMNMIISTLNINGINPENSPSNNQVNLPSYNPPVPNNLNQ